MVKSYTNGKEPYNTLELLLVYFLKDVLIYTLACVFECVSVCVFMCVFAFRI